MIMAWPWGRPEPPTSTGASYVMPSPLPPLAAGLRRCRHCGHGIEYCRAPGVEHWAIPMETDLPPGVALQNECPARPVRGFRSFYGHEPS